MSQRPKKRIQLKPHSKFSEEEDAALRKLVEQYGESNWPIISRKMPERNSRQCRERWNNYLSPRLNTNSWTPEDDQLLLEKFEALGPRWVSISKFFDGRTDQMVKNRYCVLIRKQLKESRKKSSQKTNAKKGIFSKAETSAGYSSTSSEELNAAYDEYDEDFNETENDCHNVQQNASQDLSAPTKDNPPNFSLPQIIHDNQNIDQNNSNMNTTMKNDNITNNESNNTSNPIAVKEIRNDDIILRETLLFLQRTGDDDWEEVGNKIICDIFSLY